jgi:acetoacetate decarboxylase
MRKEDILKLPSMPASGPSYPAGPYRFIHREFMVITYETDPDVIRHQLLEPLEPLDQPLVTTSGSRCPTVPASATIRSRAWCCPAASGARMPTSSCRCISTTIRPSPPAGRFGDFRKSTPTPSLEIVKDTLTGTLEYAGQLVAMGTMGYKHEAMAGNGERTTAMLSKTQINLKLIPGVDGHLEICQLVAYNLTDIVVKGSWLGPGRLHLVPHVNAPVADFPVRKIVGAHHFMADVTLPYGRVLHDYHKA